MLPRNSRDACRKFPYFQEKVVALMDRFDIIEADKQFKVEIDYPAGDGAFREGGLHVVNTDSLCLGRKNFYEAQSLWRVAWVWGRQR